MLHIENYIYGQFEEASAFLDSFEPGTGKVWARIPDSNGDQVIPSNQRVIKI